MKQMGKKTLIVAAAVVLIVALLVWYRHRNAQQTAEFQTAEVTRGDLSVTIDSTGTVEPEEVLDVGAQVAGMITSFGTDINGHTVDYGSEVAKGAVLAKIDDSLYATAVANAQAQKQAAEANLRKSEADQEQYKARLNQAERDWQRAQKIGPSEAMSQTAYDAYLSTYETAKANLAVAQAVISQARAGLAQSQAVLDNAKRNLGYCTITSPVKGVVIDRRVNIGQTVVASLNAPSLFLLAKDLTHMQIWVSVNEADIGKIHPGIPVTFTVDAFPGETFQGSVGKVRLNASMTQNVVTYTVEIITDNSNGRLLPYLTADVRFELQKLNDVLRIPNLALNWSPTADQIAPDFKDDKNKSKPAGSTAAGSERRKEKSGEDRQRLWIPDGVYVRPIRVTVGATDGTLTVVEGEGLKEGTKVVTGVAVSGSGSSDSDTRNPFTPQFRRSGGH